MWPQFPAFNLNGYEDYWSKYNGVSAELERRFSRGLTFIATYTYGNEMDVMDGIQTGWGELGGFNAIPNRFNVPSFYGPSSANFRHRAVFSYDYEIPLHSANRFLNGVIAHWSHSGILQLDNGFPYFIISGIDNENIGAVSGRPDEWPNMTCNPASGFTRSHLEWFNTACYSFPAFGTARGDAGKHTLTSDGMVNWDASLFKRWPIKESKNLEFRAEFFNLPNASTFDPPNASDPSSLFGQVTGTRQGGRNIQFGLKFHF
jgi:hypothetical protein